MTLNVDDLPETVLQFGTGRFLRAFVEFFVHQANQRGQAVGRIVVVQSTGEDRAAAINRQKGAYAVNIRGLQNGVVVDETYPIRSISRALAATSQWNDIVTVARSNALRVIVSNTTEAGYSLDAADRIDSHPPRSFPAKLLACLLARFHAGAPGLAIIPCELRENNARLLKDIVGQLANDWSLEKAFLTWLMHECTWHSSLVDRIVTGTPPDHPLAATDPLITVCEPYALWAIETGNIGRPFIEHENIVWTPDVSPYFLRKVRILNAGHTALVIKAGLTRFTTVRQAVLDAELGPWLEKLFFTEIVPTLEGRVVDPALFAREVLERFKNPFLEHKLKDIALYHDEKVKLRLQPTWQEFRARFKKGPPLLTELLAPGMKAAAAGLSSPP